MSRAEAIIKMYTNITEDLLEHYRAHGVDMERLAMHYKMLHFFCNQPINESWQHELLTVGRVKNPFTIPPDPYDNSVAHFAALIGDTTLLTSFFEERKETLLKSNKNGFHLAHFAAASKNPDVMVWIGSHPELATLLTQESKQGILPVHIAARSGITKNTTFFAENLPDSLHTKTREYTPLTLLDHALHSENPSMLAYVADLLDTQPNTASFRKSAWGDMSIKTLSAGIALSYRLVHANIPDHTSCATYCPNQNPQNKDENAARLKMIARASHKKEKEDAHSCLGLIALAASLRQNGTTFNICSDVFWVIVSFANSNPVITTKVMRFGLRDDYSFTYKEIPRDISLKFIPDTPTPESSATPAPT